jgi:hypothetical protein
MTKNLEEKCIWREVYLRDMSFQKPERLLPDDSICAGCEGYNKGCDFYTTKFPTPLHKVPRNSKSQNWRYN